MVNEVYEKIRRMKQYALNNKVPIMQDDGIDFITAYIQKKRITKILEVGSAIGYSAIMMALSSPNVQIITIEKDRERYLEAIKNVKKFKLEDRITLIFADALEAKIEGRFDLILIDAAKGKNLDFFKRYEKNLELNGAILTDNMNFHGFVNMDLKDIESRNIRGLVKKIRAYKEFLENNENYKTKFYDIGDGISVSERSVEL